MDLSDFLKIVTIIAVLVVSISISYYYVIFLPQRESVLLEIQKQTEYLPDRIEWARMVIRNDLMELTDLWEKRYATNVIIFDKDKEIGVLITAANGEEPIDNPVYFRETVRPTIELSVEKFNWLKDYKLIITIL